MAQPNTVGIIEVCRVAPPSPDHNSESITFPKSLPLTFFDVRWLRFSPPKLLYFYKISTTNSSTNFFFDSVVPRLKHSLSLSLRHFLPLAGNLSWSPTSPKPVLTYTKSDAVSLVVAKSYADFRRLSAGTEDAIAFCDAVEYRPLVPDLPLGVSNSEAAAVLAIQVTIFPNHGAFSVGIAVHKAVLDGQSFFLFVKSWAHICKSLQSGDHDGDDHSPFSIPPEMKPFYDRTTLLIKDEPPKLEAIYSSDWLNSDGPNNRSVAPWKHNAVQPDSIRGTFRLSSANIQKLKGLLSNIEMAKMRVSTFSIICAHTWVCLAKAEEVRDDKIILVFLVDCRSRLDPPLPTTYLGNCVAPRFVAVEREALLGKQGFVVAVNAIGEAMKGLANKSVLDGAENWVSTIVGNMHSSVTRRKVYSVASSPRFEIYDTDFGWGRPMKVDLASIDGTGAMSISDNRDGDGVEIGVVLKKHQMGTFASLFAQGLEFGNHKQYCSSTRKITSSL